MNISLFSTNPSIIMNKKRTTIHLSSIKSFKIENEMTKCEEFQLFPVIQWKFDDDVGDNDLLFDINLDPKNMKKMNMPTNQTLLDFYRLSRAGSSTHETKRKMPRDEFSDAKYDMPYKKRKTIDPSTAETFHPSAWKNPCVETCARVENDETNGQIWFLRRCLTYESRLSELESEAKNF